MKKISMEKIALTAAKAHAMADAAGLVTAGKWKSALKSLRGARGELLQGCELAAAKEKLGRLPNNLRQLVMHGAHGHNPNKEFVILKERDFENATTKHILQEGYNGGAKPVTTVDELVGHTHPAHGKIDLEGFRRRVNKRVMQGKEDVQNYLKKDDLFGYVEAKKKLSANQYVQSILHYPRSAMSSTDLATLQGVASKQWSPVRHNIVSFGDKTEGVHTIMPSGRHKSIYFKYN